MGMEISHRLHVTGADPDRSVTLPELPGSTLHSAPMLDRFGQQMQRTWPLAAASSIAGGVIGSKLLRMGGGGIFRGILGGLGGALAGASILTGGLALLRGDTSQHVAPLPVNSVVASTQVAERERVKVMTFNVHGGMGGPGGYFSTGGELDAIAEVIRREQPDVVLLQEVDHLAGRSNFADTLDEMDKRLDPTSSVGAAATTSIFGRDQHVAIMTFNDFTITDARNIIHQDPRGGGARLRMGATLNLAKLRDRRGIGYASSQGRSERTGS